MRSLVFVCPLFFCLQARDPFSYYNDQVNEGLLATARVVSDDKTVYFSLNHDDALQIAYQEKSPSTLEKAEGLGG